MSNVVLMCSVLENGCQEVFATEINRGTQSDLLTLEASGMMRLPAEAMPKDLAEYMAIKTQNSAVSVEDHRITHRTGMVAGMQTLGSGQSTYLVRHWLDDDTSILG